MKCVIGISGLAGDGKDSVATILAEYISKNYPKVNFWRTALADSLKEECKAACLDIYDIDPTSCSRREKEIIRDVLVFHGKVKRIETQGTYWTSKAQSKISEKVKKYGGDSVFCIPDIRYATYSNDEVAWLKAQENGFLIHVKKYNMSFCEDTRHFMKKFSFPVNKEEAKNCPKTEKLADFIIEWQDKSPEKPENDPDCVSAVNHVAKRIFDSLVESGCLKKPNISQ